MSEDKLVKEWGKVKFVPKVRNRPYNNSRFCDNVATPWKHFKNGILEKQREEKNSNAVNINSAQAQEMLKKREQNYRRNLITSQAKQPAKWEKFQDDDDKKIHEQKKDNPFSKKPPEVFKNFGIDLHNFDAKKLTFDQNNKMRKFITKGIMAGNTTIRLAAKQMRHENRKKNLKKKAEKKTLKSLETLN